MDTQVRANIQAKYDEVKKARNAAIMALVEKNSFTIENQKKVSLIPKSKGDLNYRDLVNDFEETLNGSGEKVDINELKEKLTAAEKKVSDIKAKIAAAEGTVDESSVETLFANADALLARTAKKESQPEI